MEKKSGLKTVEQLSSEITSLGRDLLEIDPKGEYLGRVFIREEKPKATLRVQITSTSGQIALYTHEVYEFPKNGEVNKKVIEEMWAGDDMFGEYTFDGVPSAEDLDVLRLTLTNVKDVLIQDRLASNAQ